MGSFLIRFFSQDNLFCVIMKTWQKIKLEKNLRQLNVMDLWGI
jgi:hypothetical protein